MKFLSYKGGHTDIHTDTQIDTVMNTNLQGGSLSVPRAGRFDSRDREECRVITYAFESRSGRKVCGTCFLYGAI